MNASPTGLSGCAQRTHWRRAQSELGFVRILCQAPQYHITIEQGRTLVGRLKSARKRRCIFIADAHGAEHLPHWVKTGRQTTDGHLCALAAANAATLARWIEESPAR
jgi:hypothetical protein